MTTTATSSTTVTLEDADSDDDIFEFLNFIENVDTLYCIDSNKTDKKLNDNNKVGSGQLAASSTIGLASTSSANAALKRRQSKNFTQSSQNSSNAAVKIPKLINSKNSTPENFTEDDFHNKFRITKATFYKLQKTLEAREQYIENRPHNPIPLEVQIMIGLRYYATGSYQNELCEFFNVHQTTIGRIVHRISYALEDILLDYIKMPISDREIADIQKNFFNIAQMENIIGVVGAKHIPLNSPHGNENILNYKNNHGIYSLILQVICDSNCRIMHIDASSPGSMSNQQVFETCDLDDVFEKRCDSGILLGDNSYECCPYLLTPLLNAESETEKFYNYYHRKTQRVIDKSFDMMLKRFPVLKNGLRVHISKSITIILGLGVLHNFCVLHKDPLPGGPP